MLILKTVQFGDSLALLLPKNSNFQKGSKWLLIPSDDGETFTLVPKLPDRFNHAVSGSIKMSEDWPDVPGHDLD